MFNLSKIDFFKQPESDLHLNSFLPQNSASVLKFKDFLNDELQNVSNIKNDIQGIEKNPAPDNEINHQGTEQNRSSVSEETSNKSRLENEVKKVANEKADKRRLRDSEKPEKNSHTENAKRGEVKLKDKDAIADELYVLLNFLKGLKAKGVDTAELRSSLKELRDFLLEGKNLKERDLLKLKGLIVKVESLFRKFNLKIDSLKNTFKAEDLAELAGFKKQIEKLLNSVKGRIEKNEQGQTNLAKNDPLYEQHKTTLNDKIAAGQNARPPGEEQLSTKNEDSGMNFQFFRKGSAGPARSQSSSDILRNSNLNNRQFQNILERAKIIVRDNRNGSFSVRLYPKSLGSVNVNLNLEEGVLVGKFLVDNNEAKESLLSNMSMIRGKLEESGISVGEFLVNVRDQQERFNKEQPEMPFYGLADNMSVSDVYEIQASYFHDGAIDVTI